MKNAKKYTVGAYMKKEVATIPERTTLKETLAVMIQKKTNGLVVVDKKNRVKGVLTILDIIRHFVPDYLETDKQLAEFETADRFASRAAELTRDPAAPLITKEVVIAHEEDTLMEAATRLSELGIRQLPVVDAEGVLVGLINRTSIKEALNDVIIKTEIKK